MSNLFNSVRLTRPSRTKMDLTHSVKFSMNAGYITPTSCSLVYPGDSFKTSSNFTAYLAPLAAPAMADLRAYIHNWRVPLRCIWTHFEDFITGGEDGTDDSYLLPRFKYRQLWDRLVSDGKFLSKLNYFSTGDQSTDQSNILSLVDNYILSIFGPGSLFDYLGYPTIQSDFYDLDPVFEWHDQVLTPGDSVYIPSVLTLTLDGSTLDPIFNLEMSSLRLRAYAWIYDECYRNPNFEPKLFDKEYYSKSGLEDGADLEKLSKLRLHRWKLDYFTSALPWPQRGVPSQVPVVGSGSINSDMLEFKNTSGLQGFSDVRLHSDGATSTLVDKLGGPLGLDTDVKIDGLNFTINDLRTASALQRFLERSALGGGRFKEFVYAHFGTIIPDARVQRPEFLGGSKQGIVISESVQTSGSDIQGQTTPQGNLAGVGFTSADGNGFKEFFTEHSLILQFVYIVPAPSYSQGCARDLTRFDRYDWYSPEFAHLGEQAITSKELYANSPTPNLTFGYAPRFAEYHEIPNTIHGDFKSSMAFWHLGRMFDQTPVLNEDFVKVHPSDVSRIFAVTDTSVPKFYCCLTNFVSAVRPMPKFATPI